MLGLRVQDLGKEAFGLVVVSAPKGLERPAQKGLRGGSGRGEAHRGHYGTVQKRLNMNELFPLDNEGCVSSVSPPALSILAILDRRRS